MLLAPAWRHSACSSSFISVRPADKRTTEAGITMRVAAMVRTNSNESSVGVPKSGVPSTCINRLIGTLSGCGSSAANCASRPARTRRLSPMPTMPPQHTLMPASRTYDDRLETLAHVRDAGGDDLTVELARSVEV